MEIADTPERHINEGSEDSDVPILPGDEEISTAMDAGFVEEGSTVRAKEP
jgi:hypothetical protein